MTDTAAFHAAFAETTGILDGLVAQLTIEHKDISTPCKDFTMHDLMNHIVGGGQMAVAMFTGEQPRGFDVDYIDEAGGPHAAWAATRDAMTAAFNDENLNAIKPSPFGEVPGIMMASVIVADELIHAWDVGQALGQDVTASDATVALAGQAMKPLITPESRNGDAFEDEKPAPSDATTLQELVAFSGRAVS